MSEDSRVTVEQMGLWFEEFDLSRDTVIDRAGR